MSAFLAWIKNLIKSITPSKTVNLPPISVVTPIMDNPPIQPQNSQPASPQLTMADVTITRTNQNSQTFGTIIISSGGFKAHTLELPWKDNQHNISCIPTGTYVCKWMPFHNTHHYELQNVPNRTGIFIHGGNYASLGHTDTEGCILVGEGFADINGDGIIDLTNSIAILQKFESIMAQKDFTLSIV